MIVNTPGATARSYFLAKNFLNKTKALRKRRNPMPNIEFSLPRCIKNGSECLMPRGGPRPNSGRPKLDIKDKAIVRLMARFTPAEADEVRRRASRGGMTVSEYLRLKALKEE